MNTEKLMIYQAPSGALELNMDAQNETFWMTQSNLVDLFQVDQSVISRHIKNIFLEKEITKESNMQKMHNAISDKPITYYSLDIALAVGYRTNSSRAIAFRQWATQTLKQHIIHGYTINREKIAENYATFMRAMEEVRALLPEGSTIPPQAMIDIIGTFANTWVSLDAYDREKFALPETHEAVSLTGEELTEAIQELKMTLEKQGDVTEIFAQEKQKGSISSIVANVFQSFDGEDVYPTIVEKSAHLLYFIIKNHPFVDGNKRSGAFAFVWFLERVGRLDRGKMTPQALTALTLLIAESDPRDKPKMIGIVGLLLK